MNRYRIKHIAGVGYFAQVKKSVFSGWSTIGKHVNGFGEYPEDHIEHPLDSRLRAEILLSQYDEYTKNLKTKPTFEDVKL